MINEQFDDLFSKLEDQVRRNPSAYRFKVLACPASAMLTPGVIILILALISS